jgi:hypothetical protein
MFHAHSPDWRREAEREALSQKESPKQEVCRLGLLSRCLNLGFSAGRRASGDGVAAQSNPARYHDTQRPITHVLVIHLGR